MSRRHHDALAISDGACNPSGIAHSIVAACREMREEPDYRGTDHMRADPAIRLMVHQLAFLMGIPPAESLSDWDNWREACKHATVIA